MVEPAPGPSAQAEFPCGRCGASASVRILVDYVGSERIEKHYCLSCADAREPHARVIAPFLPRLLVWSGVVLGTLALAADYLPIQGRSGFGWRQIAGTEVAVLLIVLGVPLRRAVVSICGVVLLGLSIAADFLRVGHSSGMGWRQVVVLAVAGGLIAWGQLWGQKRRRLRATRFDATRPPLVLTPRSPSADESL